MQLKHLKTFVAVAGTLNLTKAAGIVHLSQSSVSEQIQALEADIGAALFERGRRGLSLTPAGQALLEPARAMLALADDARDAVAEASGEVSGHLRIGGLESLCATRLPALIARYRRDHPQIEVSLGAGSSGELRRRVEAGALDAAFVYGEPTMDAPFRSAVIARDPLVIIAPPGTNDWTQLAFLRTEPGCVYRRMFDDAFTGRDMRIAGDYGSLSAVVALVEAGMGAALIPAPIVADTAQVARLTPPPGVETAPVSLLWRHRRGLPRHLAAFLAASREAVAAVDVQQGAGGEAVVHDEVDGVGDVGRLADAAGR